MIDLMNSLFMRNMGFVLILISLLFSWVLVMYRYILKVDEKKVNTEYILKGHIDFLLMGILLIIFSFFAEKASPLLILLTCLGTLGNPTMFIVLAFNPNVKKSPKSLFGLASTFNYICTTIGIGGLCILNLL
jgi:peptidoglycan/LPS O-acetylase OafA/YrhL